MRKIAAGASLYPRKFPGSDEADDLEEEGDDDDDDAMVVGPGKFSSSGGKMELLSLVSPLSMKP